MKYHLVVSDCCFELDCKCGATNFRFETIEDVLAFIKTCLEQGHIVKVRGKQPRAYESFRK